METQVVNGAEVVTQKDYDGFFTRWVISWLKDVPQPKSAKIIVTAGPYRPYGVSWNFNPETKEMKLDFYSALRAGFGGISKEEIDEIKRLL